MRIGFLRCESLSAPGRELCLEYADSFLRGIALGLELSSFYLAHSAIIGPSVMRDTAWGWGATAGARVGCQSNVISKFSSKCDVHHRLLCDGFEDSVLGPTRSGEITVSPVAARIRLHGWLSGDIYNPSMQC